MTILVADDDRTCRKIVALRLKGFNDVSVSEAQDGDDAWRLLKTYQYDGMIVDWQMPGRSGLEIVRAVRKYGNRMPLLMVTAESEKEKVIEAIRAGFRTIWSSRSTTKRLLAKLTKLIELVRPKPWLACKRT